MVRMLTAMSTNAAVSSNGSRRAIFVVGAGRSGTSTIAGALQTLGVHVPQPEVSADDTNPKGFREPQWVVDFHEQLLSTEQCPGCRRPPSGLVRGRQARHQREVREDLYSWLEGRFAEGHDEIVIKDPRLAWFIGLWRSAALRCAATPSYVTMLRPVTEVVGSKQRYSVAALR